MSGARPSTQIRVFAAGKTDVGRRRSHNEDSILVRDELRLFIVADGMGGHNAGEVASALTLHSLENFFAATATDEIPDDFDGNVDTQTLDARRLASSVRKANHDVYEIASTKKQHAGMGSTVVVVHVSPEDERVHICHVGDSRCYRIRNGEIELLTRDHSLINDALAMRPDLTEDILAELPANVITRAVGTQDTVEVDLRSEPVVDQDLYLLCSDGLSGLVSDEQIKEVCSITADLQELCELLIIMANEAGGNDNITVLTIRVTEGEGAEDVEEAAALSEPGEEDRAAAAAAKESEQQPEEDVDVDEGEPEQEPEEDVVEPEQEFEEDVDVDEGEPEQEPEEDVDVDEGEPEQDLEEDVDVDEGEPEEEPDQAPEAAVDVSPVLDVAVREPVALNEEDEDEDEEEDEPPPVEWAPIYSVASDGRSWPPPTSSAVDEDGEAAASDREPAERGRPRPASSTPPPAAPADRPAVVSAEDDGTVPLCTTCGSELVADTRFCVECGTRITEQTAALVPTADLQTAEEGHVDIHWEDDGTTDPPPAPAVEPSGAAAAPMGGPAPEAEPEDEPTDETASFCHECGAQILEHNRFCVACGSRVG